MTEASTELIVRDNPEARSYDAVRGSRVVGRLSYEEQPAQGQAGPHFVIRSTVVDPQLRGYGIGSELIRVALDDIRAKGATLTSYCWFVDEFIAAFPEYADLVARRRPGA